MLNDVQPTGRLTYEDSSVVWILTRPEFYRQSFCLLSSTINKVWERIHITENDNGVGTEGYETWPVPFACIVTKNAAQQNFNYVIAHSYDTCKMEIRMYVTTKIGP